VPIDFLFRSSAPRALAAFLCLSTGIANGTTGQPGTLDSTWANASPVGAGKLLTGFAGGGGATSLALQPDGKVVLAGSCWAPGQSGFCAVRYNADGSLDQTFGSGGKFLMNFGSGARAVVTQPDGKLVLAGICFTGNGDGFCAVRLTSNGTPDANFGASGQVTTMIGNASDHAQAIVLQTDGKILLAGTCHNGVDTDFCMARYNEDGSLDPGFGIGGKVISAISAGRDQAVAIAAQSDGNIVLAGYCGVPGINEFCAARYQGNGSFDSTFGTQGKVVTSIVPTAYNVPYSMALQPDGKLVLVGGCERLCALRYTTGGSLDSTFGTGGKVTTVISPNGQEVGRARAVAIQPDGKIVVAADCNDSSNNMPGFCALRYNSDGVLDMTFGGSGKAIFSITNGANDMTAVALQPDGRILMAGTCTVGSDSYFCSNRLDGGPFGYKSCSLDIDGDNRVLATTDSLIHARVALGITGSALVNGISFPTEATRKTWPVIREYLVTQCGMSLVL